VQMNYNFRLLLCSINLWCFLSLCWLFFGIVSAGYTFSIGKLLFSYFVVMYFSIIVNILSPNYTLNMDL